VNLDAVRRMADAVLYEGYILYPYRASAQKNRSRWQFGVVMAPGYAAVDPSESACTQTECVLEHSGQPEVQIIVRFLQVQRRSVEASATDSAEAPSWDEAVEREIEVTVGSAQLLGEGDVKEFVIAGGEEREPLAGAEDGTGTGFALRHREALAGVVSVRAIPVPGPWQAVRLQIRVANRTTADPVPERREEALPTALVAAHMIISVSGGEFISMTDPPIWAQPAVAECQNIGGWPVLAGPDGGRRVMLSAPIILYDHPELAPESPGELYDGTEIDEILTLRTLALSDAEKLEARATDPRAAALIDRVESMDPQTMARLHGTIRSPRTAASGGASTAASGGASTAVSGGGHPNPAVPWWDPDAEAAVSPDTDTVTIGGQQVARGSRVRLRPGARRSDAQDMFLVGRIAEVQAVLLDVEDKPYLAVSLADDPDEDLRVAHGRFLYFTTDEVEPCEASESEGRGVAWTEERGTSDEGRRRLVAPPKRAGDTA
jgi:hypothetical protein